jgi:hypothetical protein
MRPCRNLQDCSKVNNKKKEKKRCELLFCAELVGAIRAFAETEDAPERLRLRQLARDVGEAHERAIQREEALKRPSNNSVSQRLSLGATKSKQQQQQQHEQQRGPLDEAVDELVRAAGVGAKV